MAVELDLLNFLKTRRSIRKFKDKNVEQDILRKIFETARFAPSAGNRQPWVFVVVDGEIKNELSEIHPWASPLKNAPLGVLVACNRDTSPTSYQVDCANAAMYIMLAAHALGLGSVWIQVLRNTLEVKKIVNLPPAYEPIALIAIGWPDEKPSPRPRKPVEEIVFYNSYGVYYFK